MMPKVSGIELINHIRKNSKNEVIVIISCYPEYKEELECMHGVFYFEKPITGSNIEEIILKIMNGEIYNEEQKLACANYRNGICQGYQSFKANRN